MDDATKRLIEAAMNQPPQVAQAPQQLMVTVTTPDGPQQVPVPLAMVIILDKILDEVIAIRAARAPKPPYEELGP